MTDSTKLARLYGESIAIQAFMGAILKTLSPAQVSVFAAAFESEAELARVHLMSAPLPEAMLQGFESRCHAIKQQRP